MAAERSYVCVPVFAIFEENTFNFAFSRVKVLFSGWNSCWLLRLQEIKPKSVISVPFRDIFISPNSTEAGSRGLRHPSAILCGGIGAVGTNVMVLEKKEELCEWKGSRPFQFVCWCANGCRQIQKTCRGKELVYPVVRRWQFCPRFCQCVWFWGVSEYEWYFSWLSVHHVCVSWQGITQATSVLVCKATERGHPGGWELESFRQSSKLSSAAVAIAVCVLVRVFAWKCLRNADEVELPTKIGLLLLKRASSLECFLRGIQRQWNNGHHHVAVIDDALVLGLARWAAWLLWSERCACWADFCTNVANYERGKGVFGSRSCTAYTNTTVRERDWKSFLH